MKTREKYVDEAPLRPMSRPRAALFKIWGPAESWDNPLMGTRYDPAVKQHRDELRRADREARRAQRRRRREQRRRARSYEPPEHYTPDE
jgi:hypothetical protein